MDWLIEQTAKLVLDDFFPATVITAVPAIGSFINWFIFEDPKYKGVSISIVFQFSTDDGIGSHQMTPRDLEGGTPCSSTSSPFLSCFNQTVVAESSNNPINTAVNSGGLQMMKKILKHHREGLIYYSNSLWCRNPPPNWLEVQKKVPDVLRFPLENEVNHQDEEDEDDKQVIKDETSTTKSFESMSWPQRQN